MKEKQEKARERDAMLATWLWLGLSNTTLEIFQDR